MLSDASHANAFPKALCAGLSREVTFWFYISILIYIYIYINSTGSKKNKYFSNIGSKLSLLVYRGHFYADQFGTLIENKQADSDHNSENRSC